MFPGKKWNERAFIGLLVYMLTPFLQSMGLPVPVIAG
jgi:hypothetical protein